MTVRKQREALYKKIVTLKLKLAQLQEECEHAFVEKKHHSNTGNYDPSADCYWTVFTCPDCVKVWTEDGSK